MSKEAFLLREREKEGEGERRKRNLKRGEKRRKKKTEEMRTKKEIGEKSRETLKIYKENEVIESGRNF